MIDWIKPGVRCVCLAPSDGVWMTGDSRLQFGGPKTSEICTIAGTRTNFVNGLCISLIGYQHFRDPWFVAGSFRPLTTIERDRELFADMLRHARIDLLMGAMNE